MNRTENQNLHLLLGGLGVLVLLVLVLALSRTGGGEPASDDDGYDGGPPTSSQIDDAYAECEIEVGAYNSANGGVVYQSANQVFQDCLTARIGSYR